MKILEFTERLAESVRKHVAETVAPLLTRLEKLEARPTPVAEKGERGDKGDSGPKGEKGDRGEIGPSFLSGDGPPMFSGREGDVYMDVKTGDLYKFKSS